MRAGTVLKGQVSVNDTIELPGLKLQKQVKSMQMFKRGVQQARKGDRVGICVTQLDPNIIERGLAAAVGTVPTFNAAIASVEKIRFYAAKLQTKAKYHVSVGHTTVMATVHFFGMPTDDILPQAVAIQQMLQRLNGLALQDGDLGFDVLQQYLHQVMAPLI